MPKVKLWLLAFLYASIALILATTFFFIAYKIIGLSGFWGIIFIIFIIIVNIFIAKKE